MNCGENGEIYVNGMNAAWQSSEQPLTMGLGNGEVSVAPDMWRALISERVHNEGHVNLWVQDGTISTIMKLMQMQLQMQTSGFMTKEDAYSSIGCSPQASCRHV